MRKSMFVLAAMATPHLALADALEGKKSSAEILAETTPEDWRTVADDNLLIISLERGDVFVALSPALAQSHVSQVRTLTKTKFYDGLSFYRVIDGFVAQGGDPFEAKKTGGAKKSLGALFDESRASFVSKFTPLDDRDGYADRVGFLAGLPVGYDDEDKRAWHLHCTGAFAFGRNNERDTASTEFYITLQPQRYLDRNLTVFGRVLAGMEHLQALRRVSPPETPEDDIGEVIVSMRMASQLPEEERPSFEVLDETSDAFTAYVEARRNRPEAFFYYRPDYLDICQLPYPVRQKPTSEKAAAQ